MAMNFEISTGDCFSAVSAIPDPLVAALLGGVAGWLVTRHLVRPRAAPPLTLRRERTPGDTGLRGG